MLKTFDELSDEESLCKYCSATDYGEHKSCITPNGYYWCEGAHCEDAYREYLDDNETSENVVKYASKVILTNKEDIDEYTIKI